MLSAAAVKPAAMIKDLQQATAFISSSRPAAYREMQCWASRYAPDIRPALLEVKGEKVIIRCGWISIALFLASGSPSLSIPWHGQSP